MNVYAKIENDETKTVSIGIGTNAEFYESIGMTQMEVEQGFDGNWYLQGYAPVKPQEQIEAEALAQAKSERANAVENITVEVDGMIFQGDEMSQLRIARAIIALEDGETITWVLADDTIVKVSKEQLKQVLRKAGEKQTELWTKPYEE